MRISQFFESGRRVFSFEFFPPKTPEGEEKLFETASELKGLKPSFISVTYGAMGTTRENTLRIVSRIRSELNIETAAHLTCVGHTRQEIADILRGFKTRGVENLVALRGDPPKGQTEFKPVPGGFRYASELVNFIRSEPEFKDAFSIAVAGYPEGHIECRDPVTALRHLKHKVDQGADLVMTQLFFDCGDFFSFSDRARKAGIKVPIAAGIMPVTHGPQIEKFASMCGARIPSDLADAIRRFGDDQASVEAYGIEFATRQCERLLEGGTAGLHFYTLNKSRATLEIYRNLGLAHLR
ncbi:MAG: methylenetetrahydrofolate reductase [NAD(P)H] [Candidatus Omnitrophica bacterium]|nr:methylenetetrahydrofolate reductase [NAD(P)H] [Candidatus Omnitrophota bacterium]